MAITVFGNNPSATLTTGVDAPAQGTVESTGAGANWSMTASTLPACSSSVSPVTQFHIADKAAPTEIILVTICAGTSTPTLTVTRGAEGTTPVTHASSATFYQVVTAGDLTALKQASGTTATANLASSVTETVMSTFQPVASEVATGAMWDIIYYGTYQVVHGGTRPTLTFRVRWGGLTGTILASLVTGTGAPAFLTTPTTSAQSFDLNANINLLSSTSAGVQINFWYQNAASLSTTASNALVSSGSGVTISGNGPLVLTAQWSANSASNALTGISCTYRSS